MVGMLRKNPSRLRQYIVTLGYGPDLFRVREMILAQRRAEVSQQEVTDKHGTVAVAR
jgi:hypothetical protein